MMGGNAPPGPPGGMSIEIPPEVIKLIQKGKQKEAREFLVSKFGANPVQAQAIVSAIAGKIVEVTQGGQAQDIVPGRSEAASLVCPECEGTDWALMNVQMDLKVKPDLEARKIQTFSDGLSQGAICMTCGFVFHPAKIIEHLSAQNKAGEQAQGAKGESDGEGRDS